MAKKERMIQTSFDFNTFDLVIPEPHKSDPRNKLNELIGSEWIKFQKSWFVLDGDPNDHVEKHPATFPVEMIQEFIRFFTKSGQHVLDPFVGSGSTLLACRREKRVGIGIEIYDKWAEIAKQRSKQEVLVGSAIDVIEDLKNEGKLFHLVITSPPYWNILKKDKDYKQKDRANKGLDTKYGEHRGDIGEIDDYDEYMDVMERLFLSMKPLIAERGHLIIIVQNVRDGGETKPISFDLALRLSRFYKYLGERIWCQDSKSLHPYGYPFSFVPNIHHHYCLIFQKKED